MRTERGIPELTANQSEIMDAFRSREHEELVELPSGARIHQNSTWRLKEPPPGEASRGRLGFLKRVENAGTVGYRLTDAGSEYLKRTGERRAYLQTWTRGVSAARELEGQPLEYAGSNQYPGIGLQPGDTLYIAYLDSKRLHLIGRLPVGEIVDRSEAVRRRGPDIWRADWYAVSRPRAGDLAVFDLRVPDAIVRRLRFERSSGEITALHPRPGGALDGKALQRIRRLTAPSTALLDGLRDVEPAMVARGAHARRPTKAEQEAVEKRAMRVAAEYYRRRGWEVEDVHPYRPYDLVCRRGASEHHVEVKGLTGKAVAVELTRNEVTHAHTCRDRAVLAVVEQIKLKRGHSPAATGGRLRVYDPWRIEDDALQPLRFSYTLP